VILLLTFICLQRPNELGFGKFFVGIVPREEYQAVSRALRNNGVVFQAIVDPYEKASIRTYSQKDRRKAILIIERVEKPFHQDSKKKSSSWT